MEMKAMNEEVIRILGEVLGLGDRTSDMSRETKLLGALPEFDSMAVVAVLTAIEEEYGVEVEDDEIDASLFETVGTLTEYVESKVA